MATSKRGHGLVISAHAEFVREQQRQRPRVAGPQLPGTIFKRSDHPFSGSEGAQVSLTAEPGYTPRGWLGVPFRFQLPPHETISRQSAFNWSNFDVLDPDDVAAERSRPGGRRLRTVSVSAMFMDWQPSWGVWEPDQLDPILAARELEHMCMHGVRFRLRIRNQRFAHDDVSMVAGMTTCTISEQPSEPDTRYVQVEFQEYIGTDVERKAVKNEVGPWTHKIKDGDTLYKLSERYYHSRSMWKVIANGVKGMGNQPPSHNLERWAKSHKRRTIRIPQNPKADVPARV